MKNKKTEIQPSLGLFQKKKKTPYKLVTGGGVPGGHNVIFDGRKPFITPIKEHRSIPLRHSDVVVDIGAYVGTYAIRCARFPVKKVIAYEPTPNSYNILKLTQLPNLKIKQVAIVNGNKKAVDLFISKGIGVTNSIVLSKRKAYKIEVPAINYLKAIKEASIVKIDIEGGEYDLPIVQPNLRAVIIDFHPIYKNWIKKAEAIIQTLLDVGFKTVIQPKWDCRWTQAGSWIREKETSGECKVLMKGMKCCGCGIDIIAKTKALCPACYDLWNKKDRIGFELGEISAT